VGLLFDDFDDSVIMVLCIAGGFHFLSDGPHFFADVLDALEEGPTEEFLSDDRREKDVENGVPPPLTTIANCLYGFRDIVE
jgi:hypothetical protein